MGTDTGTGTEVLKIRSTGTEHVRVKFEKYCTGTCTECRLVKIRVRENNTSTGRKSKISRTLSRRKTQIYNFMNKNHFEKQKHSRMEFNKYDTTHLKINWGEWGVFKVSTNENCVLNS